MRFEAHPDVFELFPGLTLAVVVATGIRNDVANAAVRERWRAAWAAAGLEGAAHGNAQSHPRVAPWRTRLRAAGAHPRDFPSSIESLLRRAMKGGEPFSINPLVDAYNAVSLRHLCPAGAFDVGHVTGPIELRLSREGDRFHAMDDDEEQPLRPGEVTYADGSTVLTRHFVWKQARAGLVGPSTSDAFLVSEVLGEVGRPVAEEVLADLRGTVALLGGRVVAEALVDAAKRTVAWPGPP